MNGVYLISRHRQWRAWQFGMRHSGAMRGGGSFGGGDDGRDWNFEGFLKLPWWGKVLFVVLALGLAWLSYVRLSLFAPIALFPPVMLADGVLDMVLPDGNRQSSRTREEKKRSVVIWSILTVLSVTALISPETGIAIFLLLCLLLFLRWVFG